MTTFRKLPKEQQWSNEQEYPSPSSDKNDRDSKHGSMCPLETHATLNAIEHFKLLRQEKPVYTCCICDRLLFKIQSSPERTMDSVIGVVQQDEVSRNVLVRGEEVLVRTLVLGQQQEKIKKTEMPRKEILQDAIAYSDEENLIQLLMANDMTIKVKGGLLRQVLQVDTANDWQKVLDALLRIRAAITTYHGEAVKISLQGQS
ncbi:hypothetical protein HOLleu_26446 [Holothuria leucospilota]|uniref:Uncharacterized protein n=1 Tax=Holothuria leucospilota TaxID=206669 RepID=A0A9Q1GZY9_HOLLE|nr:hypothetical protein HOLleu_26446 [Holothuria leucospilota]